MVSDPDRGPANGLRLVAPDESGIAAAVDAIRRGRLVLHPTETVVSLSGDPARSEAVDAARRLKGYAEPRPFLCLVPDAATARALTIDWSEAARRLADAFWPGPLTLVLRASAAAPAPVVADGAVALRPAADPVSAALVLRWAGPLFSTSANRRDRPPATRVAEAARALVGSPGGEALALAVREAATPAGPVATGPPSTIVDATVDPPRLVREGAIAVERLREVTALAPATDE